MLKPTSLVPPVLSHDVLLHVSNTVENLTVLLQNYKTSINKSRSTRVTTNGALSYACNQNKLCAFDLVVMGEHQAKKLQWVGPKVWDEALYLTGR